MFLPSLQIEVAKLLASTMVEKLQIWIFKPLSTTTVGEIEICPASRKSATAKQALAEAEFAAAAAKEVGGGGKEAESSELSNKGKELSDSELSDSFAVQLIESGEGVECWDMDKWKTYFDIMHRSQGYDIIVPLDNSYKATLFPYKFKNDDDGTIKPEILDIADKCIQLYNETHDQDYQGDEDDSGATFCKTKDEATEGFYVDLAVAGITCTEAIVSHIADTLVSALRSTGDQGLGSTEHPLGCKKSWQRWNPNLRRQRWRTKLVGLESSTLGRTSSI
ncbi:OLC1v1005842C1 [Oldenlandia corymbosa var. corymbosa]|uniref:OLC1v1005842C1 n=1 Tax=Oldenlandia corymbosa var. corymbosa TaxID=529605 RepID=A0AAV1DFM8_OLDCO|nr:OLC1v1005842C1 [Oldenlandia corymbosa var. corymbosa]